MNSLDFRPLEMLIKCHIFNLILGYTFVAASTGEIYFELFKAFNVEMSCLVSYITINLRYNFLHIIIYAKFDSFIQQRLSNGHFQYNVLLMAGTAQLM